MVAQEAGEGVGHYLVDQEMTQTQLAAKIGIDGGLLSRILAGKQIAPLGVAVALEALTNIPAREFVEVV